jgi:hypothetical protein
MKNDIFFDINIANISRPDEVHDDADIVNLNAIDPSFGFVRPQKITWRAYIKDYPDLFQFIKADRLKKSMKKWFKEYTQEGIAIEYIQDLDSDHFSVWLEKYTSLLSKKDRPNLKLTQDWYANKKAQGKQVGAVFLYQDGTFIGGNICLVETEKLSVGYGVVEKRDGTSYNMGAFVDFATLQFARELGREVVSFGQDTNLYGFHLSVGLLSYKSRFGLTAEPSLKSGLFTTKFIHFEHLSEVVAFMTLNGNKTAISVIYSGEKPNASEFQARGIDEVILINRSELAV